MSKIYKRISFDTSLSSIENFEAAECLASKLDEAGVKYSINENTQDGIKIIVELDSDNQSYQLNQISNAANRTESSDKFAINSSSMNISPNLGSSYANYLANKTYKA